MRVRVFRRACIFNELVCMCLLTLCVRVHLGMSIYVVCVRVPVYVYLLSVRVRVRAGGQRTDDGAALGVLSRQLEHCGLAHGEWYSDAHVHAYRVFVLKKKNQQKQKTN